MSRTVNLIAGAAVVLLAFTLGAAAGHYHGVAVTLTEILQGFNSTMLAVQK